MRPILRCGSRSAQRYRRIERDCGHSGKPGLWGGTFAGLFCIAYAVLDICAAVLPKKTRWKGAVLLKTTYLLNIALILPGLLFGVSASDFAEPAAEAAVFLITGIYGSRRGSLFSEG